MPDTALYDLADRLYKLAPWAWMHEERIVFLHHPDTGERAFICIMGGNGEHLALAVYIGEEALHRFNLIHEAESEEITLGEADHLSLVLEARQIQVSFERRDGLEPHEYREIKQMGRSYRGGNWPSFRSFRPGHVPGTIDEEEGVWLAHAISQILEVAPGLKDDPFAEYRRGDSGTEWITRQFIDGQWQTTWTTRDMRLFHFATAEPSELLAAKVKGYRPGGEIECSFRMVHCPIGADPRSRVFPYLVMSADSETGFVLGSEFLSVEEMTYEALLRSVPDLFLKSWDKNRIRPSAILVDSQGTGSLLAATAKMLGVPLVLRWTLPAIDEAMDSLLAAIGGRS